MTYEEKSKFLKKHGWETWYHPDNWIRTEWRFRPGFKIDYAGITTEEAVQRQNPELRKNHIFVLPRMVYSKMLEGLTARQKMESAFIQINDPAPRIDSFNSDTHIPIQGNALNILNLWFDDAEEDLPLLNGDRLVLFNDDMANQIVEFVNNNWQAKMWMLHCTAGKSRSGAVGEVLSEFFQIPYKDFKFTNPQVQPNSLVKSILRKKFFYE